MAVARYTLAVDRRGRKDNGGQSADFIGCVAFEKSAEFAESKAAGESGRTGSGSSNEGNGTGSSRRSGGGNTDTDGFMNIPDGADDLPFFN